MEIEARFQHAALRLIRVRNQERAQTPHTNRSTPTAHATQQQTQGTFGPFFPNQRAAVPLWLALTLKRQKKCRVVLPDWLDDGACAACARVRVCAHGFGWWWGRMGWGGWLARGDG